MMMNLESSFRATDDTATQASRRKPAREPNNFSSLVFGRDEQRSDVVAHTVNALPQDHDSRNRRFEPPAWRSPNSAAARRSLRSLTTARCETLGIHRSPGQPYGPLGAAANLASRRG